MSHEAAHLVGHVRTSNLGHARNGRSRTVPVRVLESCSVVLEDVGVASDQHQLRKSTGGRVQVEEEAQEVRLDGAVEVSTVAALRDGADLSAVTE